MRNNMKSMKIEVHKVLATVFMLKELKEKVYKANMELKSRGLVIYTWGNASEIDREKGLVVIKPSGVDYDTMKAEDMVVVDLEGNIVEGKYKPSTDIANPFSNI